MKFQEIITKISKILISKIKKKSRKNFEFVNKYAFTIFIKLKYIEIFENFT